MNTFDSRATRFTLTLLCVAATAISTIAEETEERKLRPVKPRAKESIPDRYAARAEAIWQARSKVNEKGNATEFAGRWRMKLPAGFEYDVLLSMRDDGLLELSSPGHALNSLGDFACIDNQLRLVKPRHDHVADFVWRYRDGLFELIREDHGHGANYRGATMTRLK
ncbi:hypothetical protein ETAA8_54240 [Anatilimnocola aggregata]|uniref:Uncharacterized protein n=1 Tax=Anatilimnocola aggregata TaxID=2528021 RepID=A0A517YJB6_9BACT|nr:hypothetical protein [Anatilimnocola aggregata]QDU30304.1 hypothetical protein ETAA8_54240 [Anatilimnocola aggregata]